MKLRKCLELCCLYLLMIMICENNCDELNSTDSTLSNTETAAASNNSDSTNSDSVASSSEEIIIEAELPKEESVLQNINLNNEENVEVETQIINNNAADPEKSAVAEEQKIATNPETIIEVKETTETPIEINSTLDQNQTIDEIKLQEDVVIEEVNKLKDTELEAEEIYRSSEFDQITEEVEVKNEEESEFSIFEKQIEDFDPSDILTVNIPSFETQVNSLRLLNLDFLFRYSDSTFDY